MSTCLVETNASTTSIPLPKWTPSESSLLGSFSDDLLRQFDCKWTLLFADTGDKTEVPPEPSVDTKPPEVARDLDPQSSSQHKDAPEPAKGEVMATQEALPDTTAKLIHGPVPDHQPRSPSTASCDNTRKIPHPQPCASAVNEPKHTTALPSTSQDSSPPAADIAPQQPQKNILQKSSAFFWSRVRPKKPAQQLSTRHMAAAPIIIVTDEHPATASNLSSPTSPTESTHMSPSAQHFPFQYGTIIHPQPEEPTSVSAKARKRMSLPPKPSNAFVKLQKERRRRSEPPPKCEADRPTPVLQRGWTLLHNLLTRH